MMAGGIFYEKRDTQYGHRTVPERGDGECDDTANMRRLPCDQGLFLSLLSVEGKRTSGFLLQLADEFRKGYGRYFEIPNLYGKALEFLPLLCGGKH